MTSPGQRRRSVQHLRALDDPDARPGKVEGAGLHEARVLGRLTADEGTAGLAATRCHAADERRHGIRVQPPDGHVVEERQGLGTAADDVVRAHRDEVDADRVPSAERRRQGGLRPDAVGRRDDDRLAVAGRDRHRATEPAEPPDHLGPAGGVDGRPHPLDGSIPGGDVDSGSNVGRPRGGPLPAPLSHGSRAAPRGGTCGARRRTGPAPDTAHRSRRSRTVRTEGRARTGRRRSTGSPGNWRR